LLNRSPLIHVPKRYGSRSKALRFENQRAAVLLIDKGNIAIPQHFDMIRYPFLFIQII